MVCRLFGDNPLSEPVMVYCELDPKEHISIKFIWNLKVFIQENAFEDVICKKWEPSCLDLNE